MTDDLVSTSDAARAEARDVELAVGRVRGRIAEFQTQIERAEQDVALGRPYWLRRRRRDRSRVGSTGGPLVSVITPVFDTEASHLQACLDSVSHQTYRDWEHVLVDDGSRDRHVDEVLRRAARKDSRVRVLTHERNKGIVAASATALDAARGEYVVMLDHDDVLAPTALERLGEALGADSDAVFAYSDNDILRSDGRLAEPFYKPDFSPERLRSHNYVLHCVMARREAVHAAGGFRAGFDGAQDHDLLLRLSELGAAVHVPEVLYHWREAPTSVVSDPSSKPYAYDAGVRAVQEHCDRVGIAATVERGSADGVYRLRRPVPDELVSIVIPTRGPTASVWGVDRVMVVDAVRSIVERSKHQNLEFVVVADDVTPPDVLGALGDVAGERLTVVPFAGRFNFSTKVNAGASVAKGALLLFLNDDTELIEPDSIGEMAALLQQPDVGMVGAKLLFSDGTLQHAGHVFPGLATHALLGYPGDHPGPYRMALVERECSGVTAAAAMMRADLFAEIGRFDEALPRNFNDVDLSFRLRAAGHRIVWTPHASWFHFESKTRDPSTGDDERDLLLSRWRHEIEHDPYFNVNLMPHRSDWLERAGRSGAPPYYLDDRGQRCFS